MPYYRPSKSNGGGKDRTMKESKELLKHALSSSTKYVLAPSSVSRPLHMSKTIASGVGLTNAWFAEQGLSSIKRL